MAVCEVLERSRAILKALEEGRKEEEGKQRHSENEDEERREPPENKDEKNSGRGDNEKRTGLEKGVEVSGCTDVTQRDSNGGGGRRGPVEEGNENEEEEEEEGNRPRATSNVSFTRPVCQYLEEAREFFPLFRSYSPHSSSYSSSPSGSSPSVSLSSSITLSSSSSCRDVNKPSGGTEPSYPSSLERTQREGGGGGGGGGGGTHNLNTGKTNKELTECLENSKSTGGSPDPDRQEEDARKGEGTKNGKRGENGGNQGNGASPRLGSRRHRVCEYLDAASRKPGAAPVCDFLAALNLGPQPGDSGPSVDPSVAAHERDNPASTSPRLAEYPLKPNSGDPEPRNSSSPDPKNSVLDPITQLSSPKSNDTGMLNYPSCPIRCPFASIDHVSDAPSRISPEAPVSSPGQITIPLIPLTDLLDPRLTPPRQSTDPSGLRLSPPGTVKFPRTPPRDPTASTSSHDGKDIRRTDNHQHSPVSSFSTGVSKRTSSGLRCSYLRQSPTTTTTTATTTAVNTSLTTTTTTTAVNTSLTTTTTTTSPTVLTCQYLHRSPPETPNTTGTTSTTPTTHKCPYLQNSRVTTAVSTPTATDVTNTIVNTTSTCAATNTTIISTTTSSSTKCSYLHKAQTVTTTNASVSITNVTTKSTPQCPYLQALPRPSTSTTSSTNANTPTATNSITSNTNNNKNAVCEYLHRNATTTSSSNTVICQYLHNNQSPGNTTTTNTTNTTHTITNGSTGSANNISNIRTNNRNKNNHSTTKHEVIRNDRQKKKSRQENSRSSHLEGNGYKQERVITPPGRDTRSSEAVTIPQTNLKALHGSTVVSELGTPRTNGRVGQLFEKSNISGEPADEGRVNILPLEARGGGRSANTGHLEESPIESSVAHTTRPEAAKDWSHKCDYLKHAATSSTTNNNNNTITTNTTSRNDPMQITPVSTSKQNCEIPDRIALEISPTGTSFPCPPPFPFSTVSPRREPAGSSGHNSSQTSQISGFISKDGSTTRTFLKNTGEQGNVPNVIDDRGSGRGITCHYLRQASGAAAKTSRLTCEFLEKNYGCIDKLNGTTKGKEEMVRGKAERGEQRPPRKNQVYIDDNKAPNYTGKTFGDEAKIVSQSQQNFYQSRLSYQDLSAPVLTHLNGSPSSPQAISGRKGEAASVPFSAARGETPQPSTRASIKPADRGPRADPGSVHAPPCDGTFRATRCRTYSPTLFHPKFSIHRLAVRERDEGNFSPSPSLTSWEVLKMSLGPCPVRDAGRSEEEEEDGKEEEELSDTSGSAALEEYDPRLSLTRSVSPTPSDDTRTNDLELPSPEGRSEVGAAPAKNKEKTCNIKTNQPLTPDGLQTSKESFQNEEIYKNFDRNQDSQTASKLQRPGSQPKGGVRGPRKAELPATQEGRDSVSSVTCRMDPAVPPTTLSGAKTCGFLLRVQEVLRSLPGREAPLTTAAPETVTGGDK